MSVARDINISDARGVLVNISASRATFQLQEMYDVMDTIKAFAADSATVIVGMVYDEALVEGLRVTIVATGLGKPMVRQATKPLVVVAQKTGTDNMDLQVDYNDLDQPSVIRRRNNHATVEAMRQSGVEMLDIPAFLRKQAD